MRVGPVRPQPPGRNRRKLVRFRATAIGILARSAATDRHVSREQGMRQGWFGAISIAVPTLLAAQSGRGPYARIAVLKPHDGQTIEFEAGYLRHLEWHRQARDPWVWYGWTIWGGDRYRWFV
jgi:hypothetical protein